MASQTPILSSAFWRRLGSANSAQVSDAVFALEVQPVIAAFPGPALLLDAQGAILFANRDAARLVAALADGGAQDIRVLHAGVTATGRPAIGQILLPVDRETGDPQLLLYLTAMALAPAGLPQDADHDAPARERRVLIVARDGSAEFAMRQALIESRDLYRDLSRCSSDFAWQTDENGAFTFVSAKGALGYSAQALNGRRSLDMFEPSSDMAGINPFTTRTPIENVEVALRDAKGDLRFCKIDALPTYDRQNQWRGARGVSTDITEAKLHAAALEVMRQRENYIRAIVDATHRSLDPETAFSEAASIIAKATGALHCSILAFDSEQRLSEIGLSSPAGGVSMLAENLRDRLFTETGIALGNAMPQSFVEEDRQHQLVMTVHGGRPNGVMWLQFPAPATGHDAVQQEGDHACSLAETVASHIGIAIAHDRQMRKLAELSRTDELTGLQNRRAFMEDLNLRHAHLYRSGRKGALLYVDLDNFKVINDHLGHAAGDKALRHFASILVTHSRVGDLCARLGGDEFAIWLEDTDAAGAIAKARHLIDDTKNIQKYDGLTMQEGLPKLGASIGIAIADPAIAEDLPQLIRRGDEIMYEVKRHGKGDLMVAPPAAEFSNQPQY
ncbi:unnamed protein product [Phaeothamnion confervicola]